MTIEFKIDDKVKLKKGITYPAWPSIGRAIMEPNVVYPITDIWGPKAIICFNKEFNKEFNIVFSVDGIDLELVNDKVTFIIE